MNPPPPPPRASAPPPVEKMTGKIRLKEDTDLHQTQVLQGLEKGKQNAESVTVIHDVIEEVFS